VERKPDATPTGHLDVEWMLTALTALLVTIALVGLVIGGGRSRLARRRDAWDVELEAELSASEGTLWIEGEGATIVSETGTFGWLISAYRIDEPATADGADVARRERERYERRQSVRWDDPLRDLGERVFRVSAPLRGFGAKDHLDDLLERGCAWVVVDDQGGYPCSYVLRARDLPERPPSSLVSDDDWVYVEAWDAS